MRKYMNMISKIKTEGDFKSAVITISQDCSAYKISWEQFMKLRSILKQVRIDKGFKWGATI